MKALPTIIVKSIEKVSIFDFSFGSLPTPQKSMLYNTELFGYVTFLLSSNSE